jgi:hypothetical protein
MEGTDFGPLMGGAYRSPTPPTEHVDDPYRGPTYTAHDESGRPVRIGTFKPRAPDVPPDQLPPLSKDAQQFLEGGQSKTPLWDKYHTPGLPPADYVPPPQTQQQRPPPPDVETPVGNPIYDEFTSGRNRKP